MKTVLYDVFVNNEAVYSAQNKQKALKWIADECEVIYGTREAKIVTSEKDVTEVSGRLIRDDKTLHVEWLCPACKKIHYTDISETDKSPGLWFCETKEEEFLFFVTF